MTSFICNSPEVFFKYYLKQYQELFPESSYFINSNLGLKGITISKTRKASSLFGLITDILLIPKLFHMTTDIAVFIAVSPLNLFHYLVCKLKGVRIIQIVHDPVAHPDNKSKLVDFITEVLCRNADRIVLHNKTFLTLYNTKYIDVRYVPLLGYSENFKLKLFNKSLLLFGRIEPYKGLSNIVKYLENGVLTDWDIVIAGRGDVPKELFHFRNVTVINRFIPDEDLIHLITNTGFVFLPYDSASQSAVVLHSYSYSTPVIAHNVGALSEYVDNKKGLLFERNNSESLCEFLESLTEDKYKKIVEEVEKYFTENNSVHRLRYEIQNAILTMGTKELKN